MKKILFMLAGILFIFASCSDGGSDSPDTPKPQPQPEEQASITLTTDIPTGGLVFDEQGGEKSVEFSANKDWTLSIAATTGGTSWCTVSKESGSKGDATVTFTVAENTEYDDRSVSVTIKAGSASKIFKIAQKGIEGLLVTTTTFEVPQEGGTIDVEVKANIEYQLEIAETAKGWITEATSRALTTKNHSFAIATNEENEKREGEIYIKSGDKLEAVKVYQAGGALILLSQNEYIVSDAGETITVDVKSNVEYGVQMPDVDWIVDEASARGMSSHTLQYTILPNETYDSRSAEIIFYDKMGDVKDTLTITQVQMDAIILSQKEINVENEGGTIEVKLSSNVDFEVTMPDVDWISQVESRGLVEHSLYFTVAENASEEGRIAEIVFTNAELLLSEKVTISQKGVAYLELEQDEYTVNNAGETIEVEIKSNVEYGIQLPEVDWITKDVSTEVLKFVVAANETYDNRSAEIIFYDKNSDLKDTLTINQTQKDAIILSTTEYTILSEGDTLDIEINSNVDFTIETSVDWIKQITVSRGLESKLLQFVIDENTAEEAREGVITFIYNDLKQSAKVKQDGKNIPYVTFTADASQTLTMSKVVETMEYSVNGGEWTELGTNTVTFGGNCGELRLRGKSSKGTDGATIIFGNETLVACSGDIRTLLDYEKYSIVDTGYARYKKLFCNCTPLISSPDLPAMNLSPFCYDSMFENCINLLEAPELPATLLSSFCYSAMFKNCTSLVIAPNLPAKEIGSVCYMSMFENCINLLEVPELPATFMEEECYESMFKNCTSLVYAPELSATTLAYSCCKNMFENCTNLIKAPELPATLMKAECYESMFSGCVNLVESPALPATNLARDCYYGMFRGCVNLIESPALPATDLAEGCYSRMFEGCTNLLNTPILPAKLLVLRCYESMFYKCEKINNIVMLATNIDALLSLTSWLSGVSSSGTFTKAKEMTSLPEGDSGIPRGWTVVDYEK